MFLSGLGAVTPPVNIAAAAPSATLSAVNAAVRILIDGQPATIVYKGLAPGLAGLYQLNFTIAANARQGPAIRITIETPTGGRCGDSVSIAESITAP